MSYAQMVDWMFKLERFGIKLGLDNMRDFSSRIGNPETDFRSIHVTGTNGKGSVCTFVSEILRRHGIRVGLYTSPHLVDFRERIRVDGKMIPQRDVVRIGNELRTHMEDMASEGREKQLTFFEFTTGLAFRYFSEQKVDYVVAEVGMGGRMDATNVIKPEVAAITRVGLEHTDYLGPTLMDIAREKAGIIKDSCPTVTCERDPEVLSLFRDTCQSRSSELIRVGEHFDVSNVSQSVSGTTFDYEGLRVHEGLRTRLLGGYQAENAALAIAVAEQLEERGMRMDEGRMREALLKARWPGRLDIVSKSPLLILDGSHNPDGASITGSILHKLGVTPITFVLGCMNDKDASGIVKALAPHAAMIIVTQVDNKRALPVEVLTHVVREGFEGAVSTKVGTHSAIELALSSYRGKGVCVIGSLYLVGEALQWWNGRRRPRLEPAHKL